MQRLIDLMLWNIGRDIECDGNLLLLFGFRRYRPPDPDAGSSRYHILVEGCEVVLWGFGMMVRRDNGSVFISRHRYVPKILDPALDGGCRGGRGRGGVGGEDVIADVWSLSDLSMLREPEHYEYDDVRRSLSILFRLLYRYEVWVNTIKGREYRMGCLRAFGADYRIEDITALLRSLAAQCNIPVGGGRADSRVHG